MTVEPLSEMPADDERDLVDRARRGDGEAMGLLYDLYQAKLYRFIFPQVRNEADAQDLVQDTFLRVVDNIGRFEWRDVPFKAWVFRIAANLVISQGRKRTSRPTAVLDDSYEFEDHSIGPAEEVEQAMSYQEVVGAFSHLSETQRQIMLLRFGSGLSVKETASALGKTENNVKVLQHKAIAKLQKLLGK